MTHPLDLGQHGSNCGMVYIYSMEFSNKQLDFPDYYSGFVFSPFYYPAHLLCLWATTAKLYVEPLPRTRRF